MQWFQVFAMVDWHDVTAWFVAESREQAKELYQEHLTRLHPDKTIRVTYAMPYKFVVPESKIIDMRGQNAMYDGWE